MQGRTVQPTHISVIMASAVRTRHRVAHCHNKKEYMIKTNHGFTLIELLIVIAIIGILSSLLFVNFSGARERARDSKRKTDLTEIKNALQLYYNDYGKFPAAGAGNTIAGCGAAGTSAC